MLHSNVIIEMHNKKQSYSKCSFIHNLASEHLALGLNFQLDINLLSIYVKKGTLKDASLVIQTSLIHSSMIYFNSIWIAFLCYLLATISLKPNNRTVIKEHKIGIYIYHISSNMIYTIRLITNFSRDHIKVMWPIFQIFSLPTSPFGDR